MKKKIVDGFLGGKGYGSVAKALLNCNMDPGVLRSNATLRKDEWKVLDAGIVEVARKNLVGVADLFSRGLVYDIGNGLGTTVLETENVSDMEAAQVSLAGVTRGRDDAVEFDIGYLPLPITHKDFIINARKLAASRTMGQSLDVTQGQLAAKLVSEKIEEYLFAGSGTYTFGGGTIYGYLDFPQRTSVTFSDGPWDDSAGGDDVLVDVIAMKQAAINDRHRGPYILYVPTTYETVLDTNYTTNYPETIRERILKIGGIEDVKTADHLTADNVVLVEMSPETVRMVVGLQPTTIEWEGQGGMELYFKVMAIMVPQIRADQNDRSGIVHLSA